MGNHTRLRACLSFLRFFLFPPPLFTYSLLLVLAPRKSLETFFYLFFYFPCRLITLWACSYLPMSFLTRSCRQGFKEPLALSIFGLPCNFFPFTAAPLFEPALPSDTPSQATRPHPRFSLRVFFNPRNLSWRFSHFLLFSLFFPVFSRGSYTTTSNATPQVRSAVCSWRTFRPFFFFFFNHVWKSCPVLMSWYVRFGFAPCL